MDATHGGHHVAQNSTIRTFPLTSTGVDTQSSTTKLGAALPWMFFELPTLVENFKLFEYLSNLWNQDNITKTF